ncbi:hydrolase [Tatumella morbirosei]|uniref:Hydrolase n=1 Tax=Tatumella morbirosei TaxID=642227 RepID=A0A095TTS6_9GAMM|nr:isochorismatase family protein [Tatumella morbirosei]KGD80186.1 hydrolase [Tatumella morbirosei]
MKSALLVIDVQDSFLHRDFWSDDGFPEFSQQLTRLIAGCQQLDIPVVDVFHLSSGPFAPESGYVKRMSFLNHNAAVSVQKRVHNALTESSLLEWLKQHQVEQLVISGIRTEQCCETTARVASDLGFKVLFVSEATLTFDMQWQGVTYSVEQIVRRTELVLNGRFAQICSVDECLQRLNE